VGKRAQKTVKLTKNGGGGWGFLPKSRFVETAVSVIVLINPRFSVLSPALGVAAAGLVIR
jgi:hypothetical protein